MYCGREKSMNESALEGFVKIVELNSFSAVSYTHLTLPTTERV